MKLFDYKQMIEHLLVTKYACNEEEAVTRIIRARTMLKSMWSTGCSADTAAYYLSRMYEEES